MTENNARRETFLESYFLPLAEVTESAALACLPFIGRGDAMAADKAAVEAMRGAFQKLPIDIRIVIGEGERDKAPRLYTGEMAGDSRSSLKLDAAVDPLEGTAICAEGRSGSLSVMALSQRGQLFQAPDIYMRKIACGPEAKDVIDLQAPAEKNIQALAKALGKKPEDVTVGVLKRLRHQELIADIRKAGARVRLVGDGDVALALEAAGDSSPLDLLMGTGGAPEGVLAAAALKCLGGGFQGQLVFKNEEEERRARDVGVEDLHRIRSLEDFVSGDALFCAAGVTSGAFLEGARKEAGGFALHSLILSFQGAPAGGSSPVFRKTFLKRFVKRESEAPQPQ